MTLSCNAENGWTPAPGRIVQHDTILMEPGRFSKRGQGLELSA